jgi:Ca-activated chloride channel family protein
MRTVIVHLLILTVLWPAAARAFDLFSVVLPQVQEGNQLYQDQYFDQALEKYESAEQRVTREPRIHFNRGDALFKLGRHKEAREAYLRATGTDDPVLKKRNYYNIGNTFLAEGGFPDAIAYYRRALEIDNQYDDARFNLELALQAIQQQKQNQDQKKKQDKEKQDQEKQDQEKQDQEKQDQEKQDQEKQDQEKQDQEKQDQEKQDQEKQDQEKQDQEKQDQEKKDQEQQDQKQKQDQEKQEQQKKDQEQEEQKQQKPQDASGQKPQEEPGRLSKAQIRDLLDAMRENEKPFQMDRFMLPKFKRKKVEKDW